MELPLTKQENGVLVAILPQPQTLTQVLNIQSCHPRLIIKQVTDKLCNIDFVCNKGNAGEH